MRLTREQAVSGWQARLLSGWLAGLAGWLLARWLAEWLAGLTELLAGLAG